MLKGVKRVPELVSVVIAMRDEGRWIAEQLEALASQRYSGEWEVVVADNGSTDDGPAIARSFAGRLPGLRVIDASARRGTSHARNAGARAASGDLLLYCDGDDVVQPGWIDALVAAAGDADFVGGRLRWDLLNDPVVQATHPIGEMTGLEPTHGFLPYAPGCNLAIWADVAREVAWDERFRYGSSDEEFGWRVQLAGHRLAFAPEAVVQQRLRTTVPEMLRQQFRFGASGPYLFRRFKGWGVPRPDNAAALRRWVWLAAHVHHLARSPGRRWWLRRAAFRAGRLAGSVRHRTLCL